MIFGLAHQFECCARDDSGGAFRADDRADQIVTASLFGRSTELDDFPVGQNEFEREHVTQFLYRHPERFRIAHYKAERDLSALRWTVDEPADLAFVRAVYDALLPGSPSFGMHDVLALLDARPDLTSINAAFTRNEGLARSIRAEFGTQAVGC